MLKSLLPAGLCFVLMGILSGGVAAGPSFEAGIKAIEAKFGGRVGVTVIDPATGKQLSHRGDERFAMCSTFKWALAAAILKEVDEGRMTLDERIAFGDRDLLSYAPVTKARVGEGAMSVRDLAAAAVSLSDNTAANLLLAKIGGPEGLTAFLWNTGDAVTRLDRTEPTLNENREGDQRDTTTPDAMAKSLQKLLTGDTLSPASRDLLVQWLEETSTGKDRLRGGFPADWRAGDKTGTCGSRGAVNDVAVAWPPGRGPVFVASYLSDSDASYADLYAAHAEIGKLVAETVR
ncbi:class A beta-lactamase [Gimibacter soli]|uniref:Beta-lactamase n=1 Tax=Gimibacter soli TaxID=3024400 RepID=A0AAF0BJ43_9PROT|nr:class A beta-lactamase [Gimibacter soli]WCL52664.1 class A beta-lactamase [Gimibacter soli]